MTLRPDDEPALHRILAVRVREAMWGLRLTQGQLAGLAEVDERTIRRMVSGKGASLGTIEKVAAALQVQATDLLQKAA